MGKSLQGFLILVLAVFLPAALHAWPVPDTGVTACYDDVGNAIPCPSPGEPFYGQDGNYSINPMSFTKLGHGGVALPDSATFTDGWVMTRDNVTGLIWEVKRNKDGEKNYDDPHDADNIYTWYDFCSGIYAPGDGTEQFINALNVDQFGGFDDWRIPSIKELASIIDLSITEPGPTIRTAYFPNTAVFYNRFWEESCYWSSTRSYHYDHSALGVNFYSGFASQSIFKKDFHYVRAVRGGQAQSGFMDNGNGTVTDTSTGLTWQQATAPGAYTWKQALAYCENLTLGDRSDWRLPTLKELRSIIEQRFGNDFINTDYFPHTARTCYWSSTTCAYSTDLAWQVSFQFGNDNHDSKGRSYRVRAVRGGQSEAIIKAPVASTATGLSTNSFNANWSTVAGATGYRLDVSTSSSFSSFVSGYDNLNVSNVISHTVSGLCEGTTYYYRVRAYNASGTTGHSNTIATTTEIITHNRPPVADAGENQSVEPGDVVSLDASKSYDSDGDPLTYSWTQTAGPNVSLSNPTASKPTFTAPATETSVTLRFRLRVSDGKDTDDAFVTITVNKATPNQPPVAKATADKTTVEPGEKVTLDGSGSSDPDGTITSYVWSQIDTTGVSVALSIPNAAKASFTAPEIAEDSINLVFELKVTDNNNASATHTVRITIKKSSGGGGGGGGCFVNSLKPGK